MSYPPDRHLLRDLDISGSRSVEQSTNRIPVTPGLCVHAGVRLGVMATLVDVTGAAIALAAVQPDWIATADLSVHALAPLTTEMMEIACRPVRIGTGLALIDAQIRDDHGDLCGAGRMTFARIPGSATEATAADLVETGPVTFAIGGGRPIVDPIVDLCGMELVGPGQLRFDKSDYVRNSFGTVNGGVTALAAEAASVSAAGGDRAVDLQMHYLDQVGVGPVAVTAEVVRVSGPLSLCLVRVVDHDDQRLVAVADVTVETLEIQ